MKPRPVPAVPRVLAFSALAQRVASDDSIAGLACFALRGVKFVICKFAGRWSFGTADQSFVTFDTRERAIEHGQEVVRRIPGAELVVDDPPVRSNAEFYADLR